MAREGYYIVRTYEAGGVGEKVKYFVPGKKPTKSARKMKSEVNKQQQNDKDAVRRLARLLNENFKGGGDLNYILTYDDEHMINLCEGLNPAWSEEEKENYIRSESEKQLKLFIRRARRECKKRGIEFKYIPVTSDRDGETGEPARIHHHFIVNKEAKEVVIKKWNCGKVIKDRVWNEPDHFGLAQYLIDQVRHIPDAKRYSPSRNLVVPMPKDRIAPTGKEVMVPRGAKVLYKGPYIPGRPQYVRYLIPKSKTVRKME